MSYLTETLSETAFFLGTTLVTVSAVGAAAMLHPRTRHVTVAVTRFALRHSPRWLLPLLAVAAWIPGPVDEIVIIAVALWPVLRSARQRRLFLRTVRYAWNY